VPMWEMNRQIHELYAAEVRDPRLTQCTLARDLRTLGRARLGLGDVDEAKANYRASLEHERHPSALVWSLLLSVPGATGPLRRIARRRRARPGAP
jgi:hypothetical protein